MNEISGQVYAANAEYCTDGDSVGVKILMGEVMVKGTVIQPESTIWHGALGTGVKLDVGFRHDLTALASGQSASSMGSIRMDNSSNVPYVLPYDAQIIVTIRGDDPTDGLPISSRIRYTKG